MAKNLSSTPIQDRIGVTALYGLQANFTVYEPGFCSKYARQIVQRVIGDKEYLFGRNAFGTEDLWGKAGKLLRVGTPIKPGDLLFQDWSDDGHVGIVVRKNGVLMIAENTIRYGYRLPNGEWRKDFRALTTFEKFGRIKSIGRYGK